MTTPSDNAPSLGGQHTNDVKLGGDSALLHLINSLDHSDPNVRSRAALMLAGRGNVRAYETLIRVYEEGPQFRQGVVRAFGKLKDARATDRLVALLFDTSESRRLRITAAQALGDSNIPQAVEALLTFLEHHSNDQSVSVPIAVIKKLAELREPRAIEIMRKLLHEQLRPADAYWLFGYRWRSTDLSIALAEALKVLQGPMLLTDLAALARSGDMTALGIICLLRESESIPELLLFLHQMIELRRESIAGEIIRSLREHRDQRILDFVFELLDATPISDHRLIGEISDMIGSYDDERVIEPILGVLPKYPYATFAATKSLYRIGGDRAIEAIRALLIHEHELVRSYAQSALNDIHTPEAMRLITEALPHVAQLRRQQR
jgi:HEAT repeat protein